MQPTFLPWLGYFALAQSVDTFVFLDSVQFESRSWQQRNRILINGEAKWMTIPTTLPFGRLTRIDQVLINQEHYSGLKLTNTLRQAYAGKAGLEFVVDHVLGYFNNAPKLLAGLNVTLIKEISHALEIKVEFHNSSEIGAAGAKAELLLNICNTLGAKTYVSPPGSKAYLDEYGGFSERNIKIEYHNFVHPIYSQGEEKFTSHLSIVDAICNVNLLETKNLIRMGDVLYE
jgi:hypothetical protein